MLGQTIEKVVPITIMLRWCSQCFPILGLQSAAPCGASASL